MLLENGTPHCEVHEVLYELGAVGWPKTSSGPGLHVYVGMVPGKASPTYGWLRWHLGREVERRSAGEVTTAWWRKDRDRYQLFVDNQNARDHTIAAAYSVRGNPRGTSRPPFAGKRSMR